jgi:hypothetical protein
MRSKQRNSRLAVVSKLPTQRSPGRPKTKLTSAVDGDEREVLVVLRRKLASRIDASDIAAAPLAALVKQFRDIDARIRAIDVAAVMAAEEADDDEDEDEDDSGFDLSNI